jgi:DNA-directed RNA polymerase specialized sigma subunit
MNEQDAMEQHEDILHMIRTAVKELEYSEQDILAYQMRYLYDYKVSEIAQMLKLEQSVLYNRMNQINKVLRQSYSGYLGTLSRTSRREP